MKLPGNFGEMLHQVQNIQQNMAEVQAELEKKTVEASAGGGMVNVKVSGTMQVTSIKIEPVAVNPEDIQMLEDLVTAAVNEGLRKAKDLLKEELGKLTGGLPIPGLG